MLDTYLDQQAGQSTWFPDERVIKKSKFLRDFVHNDFDEHAALLGGVVALTQLGSGEFNGRILFAQLENIIINIDYSNQPLEKEFQNTATGYNFGLIVDQPTDIKQFGGYPTHPDRIVILPPEGTGLMHSPAGLTLLQFSIKREAMAAQLETAPELADWFHRLNKRPARVVSPWLAQRLRSDCFSALEAVIACKNENLRRTVDRLLIMNIVNALNMELLVKGPNSVILSSSKLERFRATRNAIHEQLEDLGSEMTGSIFDLNQLGSKRSVEKSFSSCIKMGPLTYSRIVRLHHARRRLLDEGYIGQSIGDIAAEFGFLDWSKFSIQYRKHFGERPSETRERLLKGKLALTP